MASAAKLIECLEMATVVGLKECQEIDQEDELLGKEKCEFTLKPILLPEASKLLIEPVVGRMDDVCSTIDPWQRPWSNREDEHGKKHRTWHDKADMYPECSKEWKYYIRREERKDGETEYHTYTLERDRVIAFSEWDRHMPMPRDWECFVEKLVDRIPDNGFDTIETARRGQWSYQPHFTRHLLNDLLRYIYVSQEMNAKNRDYNDWPLFQTWYHDIGRRDQETFRPKRLRIKWDVVTYLVNYLVVQTERHVAMMNKAVFDEDNSGARETCGIIKKMTRAVAFTEQVVIPAIRGKCERKNGRIDRVQFHEVLMLVEGMLGHHALTIYAAMDLKMTTRAGLFVQSTHSGGKRPRIDEEDKDSKKPAAT